MDRLLHNLTSGTSYLTQHSANPATDGQTIYDNIMSVSACLFGEEPADAQIEIVIDAIGSGLFAADDPHLSASEAAQAINSAAKRAGGTGWLR